MSTTLVYIKPDKVSLEELDKAFSELIGLGLRICKRDSSDTIYCNSYTESSVFNDSMLEYLVDITDSYCIDKDRFGNKCYWIMLISDYDPGLMVIKKIMEVIDPGALILYEYDDLEEFWTNIPELMDDVMIDGPIENQDWNYENEEVYPFDEIIEAIKKFFPGVYEEGMTIEEINDALSEANIELTLFEPIFVDFDEAAANSDDWFLPDGEEDGL